MSHDSSVCINTFREDAFTTPVKDFTRKHGLYFLIRDPQDHALNPTPYNVRDAHKGTQDIPDLDEILGSKLNDPETIRVYALGSPKDDVGIGRVKGNRIRIDDVSLSSRHAVLNFEDHDQVLLTDLGSRNGTSVGNERLDFGRATPVQFGKNITLGAVRLTLLKAEQFVDLVKLVSS